MTGRFVVVVLTVAVLTVVGWGVFSSWGAGLEHAMALLVVTCPCALALATPVAMAIALSRAAHKGILIKGADAIERLATPGVLFLDKTGTITEGRSALAFWHGADRFRAMAAAVEKCSAHPIAKAIAGSLTTADAPVLVATDVHEAFGYGISAGSAVRRRRTAMLPATHKRMLRPMTVRWVRLLPRWFARLDSRAGGESPRHRVASRRIACASTRCRTR